MTVMRHTLAAQLIRGSRAQGTSAGDLADALQLMRAVDLEPDQPLYEEGARADCIHVLTEGTVEVLVGPDKAPLLRIEGPTILGQLGVLSGLPRSATVIARTKSATLELSQRDLWELVEGPTPAGAALRRVLLAGLAHLVSQTGSRLSELVSSHGQPVPKGAHRIDTPASKPKRRSAGGSESLNKAFSDSLLAQLDDIKVVQTEADRRRRKN